MTIYAITGNLGAGKSLVSVGRIRDYLFKGRKVATNLDLDLSKLCSQRSKARYIRLSDFPSAEEFEALGLGNESLDETKNGLIVLDECGVFFNSRDWADPTRKAAIAWLLHSRKKGWDVIFIVQEINLIDKQIRVSMIEHVGVCKRADRLTIPFIGYLLKFLGLPFRPPRLHICSVRYGISPFALVVDRWVYRGTTIQGGYDTRQVFRAPETPADYSRPTFHTVLSPWETKGKFLPHYPLKFWASLPYRFLILLTCKMMRYDLNPPRPEFRPMRLAPEPLPLPAIPDNVLPFPKFRRLRLADVKALETQTDDTRQQLALLELQADILERAANKLLSIGFR